MGRYFYDLEFLEDGQTIELISLGMVADDGREFYGVSLDAPWERIASHEWLMGNVVPSLPMLLGPNVGELGWLGVDPEHQDAVAVMPRADIAAGVLDLIGNDPFPQLWAYYGAYDHVALMQLWGLMITKPRGLPMWTHDLIQERERHGNPELPGQADGHHNALADARWTKRAFEWLNRGGGT